jgi:Pyruvate/2-oxoacid:ferredoxin oxidoreductase delta subunit
MNIIISDAPLIYDKPVDYGVPAICDACKACVVNCPPSAIRSTREMYRGVYKAKIKTERCLPIVAQVAGCAVCQKVCPAQRYGLPAVINEFKASGKILGRGTDELEGYIWPVDGKYYGAGERPDVTKLLNPAGWKFDPTRRVLPMYDDNKSDAPVSLAED